MLCFVCSHRFIQKLVLVVNLGQKPPGTVDEKYRKEMTKINVTSSLYFFSPLLVVVVIKSNMSKTLSSPSL